MMEALGISVGDQLRLMLHIRRRGVKSNQDSKNRLRGGMTNRMMGDGDGTERNESVFVQALFTFSYIKNGEFQNPEDFTRLNDLFGFIAALIWSLEVGFLLASGDIYSEETAPWQVVPTLMPTNQKWCASNRIF